MLTLESNEESLPDTRIKTAMQALLYATVSAAVGTVLGVIATLTLFRDLFQDDDEADIIPYGLAGGAAVGFLLGAIVFGWLLARRRGFSPGIQALIALWIPAGITAGVIAAAAANRVGLDFLGVLTCVLVWLLLLIAIVVSDKHETRTWLAFAAVAVCVPLASVGSALLIEPGYRTTQYQEAQTPLALVDEAMLAEVLPGWTVDRIKPYNTRGFGSTAIKMSNETGLKAALLMEDQPFSCGWREACRDQEPLTDGSRVILVSGSGCSNDIELVSLVVVRPTGTWTLGRDGRCSDAETHPTLDQLELLLVAVRPASAAEWVDQETDTSLFS